MAQSSHRGGVASSAYLAVIERFVRFTPFLVACTGAAVLVGWFFDVQVLKSVIPGSATMKVNTACAFMVVGSAMWFLAADAPVSRLIARGLLVLVVSVGALTLAESVFSFNLGIDQLIMSHTMQSGAAVHPGRMSLATSVNFCLIGIALLMLPPRSSSLSGSWAVWVALPVGLISMVAIVGYAYDASALYQFGPYDSMAIHTAWLFGILSLDVLCANPNHGIVSIAISKSAAGVVSRRLLPTIPLALFGLGWLRLSGQNAGLYDTHTGLAIMVVASIAVSTVAVILTVSALHAVDLRREGAEIAAAKAEYEAGVLANDAEQARSLQVVERRRREASQNMLAVSESYLEFALRSQNLGAWTLDLKTHAVRRTAIHAEIFGYTVPLAEWTYDMFLDHVIPQDRNAVDACFQSALAAQSDWAFNCRIRRADGAIRQIMAAGTHRRDAEGHAVEIQGIVQDVTERRRIEDVQREMTALVASTDDTIVTKGLDGVIRSWNPAAQRLLGYRADEIVGQSIARLIPEDRQNEESMIMDQVGRGERVSHFETVRRRKDGSLVDVSLTISPILDGAGAIVGASKIMRDITERKRVGDELRRINEDLEEKNTELDEFVYTASHDLRSPLNGVNTLVQWILDDDGTLAPETRARLMLIRGRIERMKRLLTDIRDYARAGEFAEPSGTSLTASELVADIAATAYVPAGFSIRRDASLEAELVCRVPLQQVLHNLIGNAIKHHHRETGFVMISVQSRGPRLRFFVADDGPGIPAAFRESIFDMFKTLKPRDEVEGSGMGLAIVRKIVARMGGNCGIDEAHHGGAIFWFDWPRFKTAGR
jgi:PAS domain S-box-containing protein